MQSVSSRIWTCVAMSIYYDDNHYTTSTSKKKKNKKNIYSVYFGFNILNIELFG